MISCMHSAAEKWNIPEKQLISVYENAQKKYSVKGVGVMHIPEAWLPRLKAVGFSVSEIKDNKCENIQAAAAILAAEKQEKNGGWKNYKKSIAIPACLIQASNDYHMNVATVESYYRAAYLHGQNGSVGVMHIPEVWLPILKEAGFPEWQVRYKKCWNIGAGVWILSALSKNHSSGSQYQINYVLHKGYIPQLPRAYLPYIDGAARRYHVEPSLIEAVMAQESGFDPRAVSPAGAEGLMQMIPATAQRYHVSNPFSPRQSIYGGTAYLAHLLREFHDNVAFALAGYNAGGGAVKAWHGIPPYKQTENYVPAVLDKYYTLTGKK